MNTAIPLEHLPTGQSARVGQLVGEPEQVHRMMELGLRSGTQVEMLQSGSPCVVRLQGNKMCFRRCDLFDVLVHPDELV